MNSDTPQDDKSEYNIPPAKEEILSSQESECKKIEERLSTLEQQLQDIEIARKVTPAVLLDVQAYINDLKKDLNSIRRLRLTGVIVSVCYVTLLNALLLTGIFCFWTHFKELSHYTQIAIILISVSSTIGLLIAILKGAFKTYGERYKEDYLPPHLQTVFELLKEANKK